jgi:hypothetical protein
MTDPLVIKAHYASLSTEQLIYFVNEEAMHLTDEAVGLLKAEFHARQLDTDIIDAAASGKGSQQELIQSLEKKIVQEISRPVLTYVLNEKRDGKTDAEISASLLDTGLDEEQATLILSNLETNARKSLEKANKEMLTGVFILLAGVAVNLINKKSISLNPTSVIAGCAILFGIILFLASFFNSNKYRAVINNIKAEHS